MRAIKIKMQDNCKSSNNLLEIDSVYVTGCDNPQFFKKAVLYDYLIEHPGSIQVNIYPFPDLIPAKSKNGEKYVKSTPDNTNRDNLLSLPRE